MKKNLSILLILFLLPVSAQETVELDYEFLNQVGLDSAAYKRYEALINTKGLVEKTIKDDPVIVLGMYAENDDDRRKYAKMYMDREIERADRMMRFINIYYEVFDKEVGSKPMVDMSGFKSTSNKIDLSNESLAVFFSIDCTQCKSFAANLQSLVKSSKIKSIDIYFKDHESDTEISDWAKEVGVDIGLVNSKQISLNSGSQLSEQLGITGDSKIFVRKGERLEELSFSDLLGMY